VAEVPEPHAGPGQVRIRVEAAAANPVDNATRAGVLAGAGVVDQVNGGPFSVGDRVIGLSDRLDLPTKGQAEFVVLDTNAVAAAPDADLVAASTLPLNGSTALQALDLLGVEAGETLLVTGAAGAVGGFAVELAVAQGLRVVATASDGDEELVRGLGAEVFVPRSKALAEEVRRAVPGGVDGALDAAIVGVRALDAVRNGGGFIAVVAGVAPPPLRGINVRNVWVRADGGTLQELSGLVAQGKLTLRTADTLPFAEVAEAHRRLEKGGLRGRLVLRL